MNAVTGLGARLIGRAAEDILFRAPGAAVTGAGFLASAQALAQALPDATHVVNLCRDRYYFTVALAAAVLRGQVSLLTSDRSPSRLRSLAARYPDTCSVSDDPAVESPLPHHLFLPSMFMPSADFACENPPIPDAQLAAIIFTSGSTGEPVGNSKSWGVLTTRSRIAADRFGFAADQPAQIVGTIPPQHMYGFETTVMLPLQADVASWCGTAFYPVDIQRALAAVPTPRVLVTTPLQIRNLLAADLDLPELAQVISATAPLQAEIAAAAERRWGAPVKEIFGATEVGSIATRRTVEGDRWHLYPGLRLERRTVRGDAPAEVVVCAPFAEPCLLNDDVELLDSERFLLLGRKADLIKLAGKRASLAGLNLILNAIDGVADGVFVAPDDLDARPSARLLAFVVAPERSAEDILVALRARIDPIFLPRRIILVDDLPRNDVGKVPLQALAALQARLGET